MAVRQPLSDGYKEWARRSLAMEAHKDDRRSNHWRVLEAWCREFGWKDGAEIGVQRGWTSFHLLGKFPDLSMTLVDNWLDGDKDARSRYVHIKPEYCARHVKERAAEYGRRCTVFHMPSSEGAKEIEDGSLDFVFIDDDHSYEGAKTSILSWASKVRVGGYITGHDVTMSGVKRALDELLPGWNVEGRPEDEVWWREKVA